MANPDSLSFEECRQKLKCTDAQLTDALKTVANVRVITGYRIDGGTLNQIREYLERRYKNKERKTIGVDAVGARTETHTRKISGVQVEEKKRRPTVAARRPTLDEMIGQGGRTAQAVPGAARTAGGAGAGAKADGAVKAAAGALPSATEDLLAAQGRLQKSEPGSQPETADASAADAPGDKPVTATATAAEQSGQKHIAQRAVETQAAAGAAVSADKPAATRPPLFDKKAKDSRVPAERSDVRGGERGAGKPADKSAARPQPIGKKSDKKPAQKFGQKPQGAGGKPADKKPRRRKKKGTIHIDDDALRHHKEKREQSQRRANVSVPMSNEHRFQKPVAPIVREVKIPEAVAVNKLAADMSLKTGVVLRKLMEHGMTVTANDLLDRDTAWIIVEELGHIASDAPVEDIEQEVVGRDFGDLQQQPRAPVVTVMGHVDHGKTSLLDYIRKSRVVSGEAGGITQHIGAYRVESAIGPVTFIDTPGHALFTQMRARGAKVTDIVVLVVAADDGVKEQTVEAINHAKAAEVPVVVAINKIDKPEANAETVRRDLAVHGIVAEQWGGDSIFVPVSAHTGEGIDALLEALATQAEIMELKAPKEMPGRGVVIETRIDKGRGVVATIVVTHGTIRKGDIFLCGAENGRVRTMWSASDADVRQAQPSEPVEVQGLSGVPEAGADIIVVEDERKAREVADMRRVRSRDKSKTHSLANLNLNNAEISDEARAEMLLGQPQEVVDLNVVLKADVEGSREALWHAASDIAGNKAKVKVVHSAVGAVTESDVYLAQTGKGTIVAFNVRANAKARVLAESRGVKIIYGNIIYDLVEKIRDALLDLLPPIVEEKVVGAVEVKELYNISKIGTVAGCAVTDGKIQAGSLIRLVRDGVNVYDGKVGSLYHFKNAVAEVVAGAECGINISKYNDVKVGDVIEAIDRTELPPEM